MWRPHARGDVREAGAERMPDFNGRSGTTAKAWAMAGRSPCDLGFVGACDQCWDFLRGVLLRSRAFPLQQFADSSVSALRCHHVSREYEPCVPSQWVSFAARVVPLATDSKARVRREDDALIERATPKFGELSPRKSDRDRDRHGANLPPGLHRRRTYALVSRMNTNTYLLPESTEPTKWEQAL